MANITVDIKKKSIEIGSNLVAIGKWWMNPWVYDPQEIKADAFDMDNMVDWIDKHYLTTEQIEEFENKQDALTAGENIDIANNVISATDTTYTAWEWISIDENNVISNTRISAEWWNIEWDIEDQTDLQEALADKQDVLTVGANVQIENNVISATDTTYTAGEWISIDSNNVISNTQTSAEWWNIEWDIEDQTDLKAALDSKQNTISDLSQIRSNATAGKNASDTIATYWDIVTHNVDEFVTSDAIGEWVLTIQKNSTTVDTFSANAKTDKTINITVPTQASDIGAMPDTTKYAANLEMSLNSSTYVITTQLKDQDGNNIWAARTIDLPLESVVVDWEYDAETKKIILTLENGNTIEFSVADLVSGLQTEITVDNKLDADLVDDSTSTNKFVTAADLTKLSNTSWVNTWDQSASDFDIKDLADTTGLRSTWSWKQDAINDLNTIRDNASAGKTASNTIATYWDVVTHDADEFATSAQWAKADTALQSWDDISELNNDAWYVTSSYHDSTKQDVLTAWDNVTIDNNEISVDLDWYQTIDNMVQNLDDADHSHYPTAKAVKDAIASGWWWDVSWPSSSVDWNVVLFDWTTWKTIKDSGVSLSDKQDVISDLDAIRNWAGLWATAIQPNDNISELTNDAWYITSAPVTSVNNQTWDVVLTIPTTASDVWALPNTTKYWAALTLEINSSTYVVTATLKDQDWNTLGTAQTIDLPLESVVVSWSYDDTTKKIILTLQSWSTVEFSVADLVSWLQSEITSTNKLSSDLVDDTNHTNKFVTAAEKTKLSNLSWTNTWDETWTTIKTKLWAASASQDWYLTSTDWSTFNNKQNAISDLAAIRSGAEAGATALQPWDNISVLSNDAWYLTSLTWVTSVNWNTWAVTVSEFEPDNAGTTDQVLTKTASWYEWANAAWSDYSWVTKTITNWEIEIWLRTIVNVPTSNFTLTLPATLKEWEEYAIRIISETSYTMTLWTWFTNPRNVDTTLSGNATDQYVFLAINGELELQPLVDTWA